jgi:endonuclease III
MKDSNQYAKKIQRLYRTMKRRSRKVSVLTYEEPVDALVYAVVSQNCTESQAGSAIKKIKENFVDYNDLRVARPEEVSEVLGQDFSFAHETATALASLLMAVFNKYSMLSLQGLRKLGKRPAKVMLGKLAGVTPFVVDYCTLTSLGGHAIPLTPNMLEYLKANGLINPEAGYEDAEGFLSRQIAMKNAYEFYSLLRRESEPKTSKSPKKKKRKKTKEVKQLLIYDF